MTIIYRGSRQLSHLELDNNFHFINDNMVEVTDTTGSAFIPVLDTNNPNNSLVDGAFFYDPSTNNFSFYSNGVKRVVLPRGYTGSVGELTGGTGLPGYDGSKGISGSSGSAGLTGESGITGYTGSLGYTGSKGPPSTTSGNTGSKGPTGPRGSTGPIGMTGLAGASATLTANHLVASVGNPLNLAFSDNSTIALDIGAANKSLYGVGAELNRYNLYVSGTYVTSGVTGTTYRIPMRLNRQSNGTIINISRSTGTTGYKDVLVGSMSSLHRLDFSTGASGLSIIYDCTASDYRLKENVKEITKGKLSLINKLKTYSYKDIFDDKQIKYGVLAHELAEVFPSLVSGEKDAVDEQNKPIYQTVDYAGLIPSLTLALKELAQQIEDLEKRIDNL